MKYARRWQPWTMLLFTLVGISCRESMKTISLTPTVSIRVPSSVVVTQRSPVEDFVIAEFASDGKIFMNAYVGNFPDFPSEGCVDVPTSTRHGQFASKQVKGNAESGCQNEILVYLNSSVGWPNFVHFRVLDSDEELSNEIETIASSLRLIEGRP